MYISNLKPIKLVTITQQATHKQKYNIHTRKHMQLSKQTTKSKQQHQYANQQKTTIPKTNTV